MKPIRSFAAGIVFSLFVLVTGSPANAQIANLITGNSAGKVKIGMTVGEARNAMRGFTFSRVSDGEGIALIEVKRRNQTQMRLYAGEFDPKAAINNSSRIEFIEVWSSNYRTAEGVYPRMRIAQAERKYGKILSIMLSEIESREFARFTNQPKGVDFRIAGRNRRAGIYPSGSTVTTRYSPTAYLSSIIVLGTPLTGSGQGTGESTNTQENNSNTAYQNIDVRPYNSLIDRGLRDRQAWVRSVSQVVVRLIGEMEEMRSRTIQLLSASPENSDSITAVITDEGLLDDSVRAQRTRLELRKDNSGVWKVLSGQKSWSCQNGRGHQDFSAVLCN
ncbi:MAG: hypothetical protein KDB79_13985 [Acidobacteria bacterium]|nr:hypothetical protein [Acidobacteriota bacterium]